MGDETLIGLLHVMLKTHPLLIKRIGTTSKWEGLMPQVGWDSSKREGRFRVGLGHINKAQPWLRPPFIPNSFKSCA